MKSANWMGSITQSPSLSVPEHPSLLVRLADRLLEWLERSRQRNALARLDDRMLADIGCDPSRAQVEASKFFWEK